MAIEVEESAMAPKAAQPILPNMSQLGLVRTGMMQAPGPGDEYLFTPDYFISVLEQVENISDLRQACNVVKTWCGADKGRNEACKSPAADQAWAGLMKKLFGQYAPPPKAPIEAGDWQKQFYNLCNLSPVERLVRIGLYCYSKWEQEELAIRIADRALPEEERVYEDITDVDGLPVLDDLTTTVIDRLAVAAGFSVNRGRATPPKDVWTTERDDKADVALALTDLATQWNEWSNSHFHKRIVFAIVDVMRHLTPLGRTTNARQAEQLALLILWLFDQRPDFRDLGPLLYDIDAITDVFYGTLAEARRFRTDHGLLDKATVDRVDDTLEALRAIAEYRDKNNYPPAYDWSEYATPVHRHGAAVEGAESLLFFLRHGTNRQKRRVCDIVQWTLHITSAEVSHRDVQAPRKIGFFTALTRLGMLDALGTAGINDYDLSRRSLSALSSLAKQLAQRLLYN